MIVFLASEDHSNLLQNSEEKFIHKYVKWRYDLNFFLREEYANLMAMDPEWIVIEEKAIDDPSKIDGVIQCFPRAKFIYITSQKEEKRISGKCRTIYTDGFLKERLESMIFGKKVNLVQEQKKIGVITDQDPELAKRFTLNLLYCIKRSERLLVYTEVGQESGLVEAALKYGLLKTEKGYEYDGIPILHNLVIGQALINLFDFGVTEEQKEKMFEKCDYRFRISLEGKRIKVDLQEQTYTIAAFEHPFQPGQERFYADLLPELHLHVPDAKMKRYKHHTNEQKKKKEPKKQGKPREKKERVRLLQKKERSQKVKKSKPTKKPRVKIQIPKPSLPKPNLSKWKERYLTKRRLMIFVGILAMISIVAAGLRTYSASQKKEQIKEAVKEQQSTVVPSTAEKKSEKVTTEKKKNKKSKPTTEDIQKTTSSQPTTEATVSNTAATRHLNQGSRTTKRPRPTTTRKKRVTTTRKKKTTTTQRPKPTTTTERFEIEHGPE